MKQFPLSVTTIITPYAKVLAIRMTSGFPGQVRNGRVPFSSDLKGPSNYKLLHMRIRYHFLADLHDTKHARETASEKVHPEYSKQTLWRWTNYKPKS